jgi:drug/metabolite transporter (DMT)-like permease
MAMTDKLHLTPLRTDSAAEKAHHAALPVPPAWLMVACAIAINLIWAFSYPVSKLVLTDVSVEALSCWRLVGAALLLAPFLRRLDFPADWTKKDLGALAMMGLVGLAGAIWLQYAGTVRTTASNVSMIVATEAVMLVMLAAVFLKEPMQRRTWAGLAAAVAGVGFISVDPATLDLFSGRYWVGNLLMVVAIAGFASYTIFGKGLVGRWSAKAMTVLPLALAGLVMLPLTYFGDPAAFQRGLSLTGMEAWGIFFIVGPATAIAYMVWNWVLRYASASALAYSLYVQPVAGALLSAWMLKETLAPTYWWGAGLILLAMTLGAEHKPAAPAQAQAVADEAIAA